MKNQKYWLVASIALLLMTISRAALAHSETGVAGGLVSGLLHPVLGLDHLVAMVAVGLWGAVLRQPAIWLLPVAFPVVMALGALLGVIGIEIPGVEIGIAVSAIALGALVLFKLRLPIAAAAAIVSVFAVFHGHAHGTEIPSAINPLAYGVGFVTATGLLHLAGILVGTLMRWPAGQRAVQACGLAVLMVGSFTLALQLGVVS